MSWEKREILLVVKTYPSRSKHHQNTVCTAGILEDTEEWIRVYPIKWLRFAKQNLKKFVRFSAEIQKDASDYQQRKESYKIKESTIKIIDDSLTKTKTKGVWEERTKILLKTLSTSAEELDDKFTIDKTSLGLIKPNIDSVKFRIKKPIEEIKIDVETSTQYSLLGEKYRHVDEIERAFSYKFKCENSKCKGHDRICEDWELIEAFRSYKNRYDNQRVENTLNHRFGKWLINERNLYFVVGMHWRFPKWMIIGLYYPPKIEKTKK